MALPDFRDERRFRGQLVEFDAEHPPVNVAFENLESFSIHTGGIPEVEVGGMGSNCLDELGERPVVEVAGQFRMGGVKAHPVSVSGAE